MIFRVGFTSYLSYLHWSDDVPLVELTRLLGLSFCATSSNRSYAMANNGHACLVPRAHFPRGQSVSVHVVSRPFASNKSPNRIDREGLGKRRTGTRQMKGKCLSRGVNVFPQCIAIQITSALTLEQVRATWRNVLWEIHGYHRSATFQRTISLFALLVRDALN